MLIRAATSNYLNFLNCPENATKDILKARDIQFYIISDKENKTINQLSKLLPINFLLMNN